MSSEEGAATSSAATPPTASATTTVEEEEEKKKETTKKKAMGGSEIRTCEECGKKGTGLSRCSRCKAVWYCSTVCQRRNWDIHRHTCEAHEIADGIEARGDEKLAEWMRTKNRKVAVVTRGDQPIEYGKLPKPQQPPTKEELEAEEQRRRERAAKTAAQRQREEVDSFVVENGFGLVEDSYRWTQTQHNVSIIVPLGGGGSSDAIPATAKELKVAIGPEAISVVNAATGKEYLAGTLSKPIKAEESAWQYDKDSGVFTFSLLKRWRSGNYAAGTTNADTWWKSLFVDSRQIDLKYPPTEYYSAPKVDVS